VVSPTTDSLGVHALARNAGRRIEFRLLKLLSLMWKQREPFATLMPLLCAHKVLLFSDRLRSDRLNPRWGSAPGGSHPTGVPVRGRETDREGIQIIGEDRFFLLPAPDSLQFARGSQFASKNSVAAR
jgi:hypothetical protein